MSITAGISPFLSTIKTAGATGFTLPESTGAQVEAIIKKVLKLDDLPGTLKDNQVWDIVRAQNNNPAFIPSEGIRRKRQSENSANPDTAPWQVSTQFYVNEIVQKLNGTYKASAAAATTNPTAGNKAEVKPLIFRNDSDPKLEIRDEAPTVSKESSRLLTVRYDSNCKLELRDAAQLSDSSTAAPDKCLGARCGP